jgi:hypothetical protein
MLHGRASADAAFANAVCTRDIAAFMPARAQCYDRTLTIMEIKMAITLDYQVNMSCYGTSTPAQSIGTDGLATCVGIIAVTPTAVFCGHMASAVVVKPSDIDTYAEQACEKLKAALGASSIDHTKVTSCALSTTAATDPSSKAIMQGFRMVFADAPDLKASALYYKESAIKGTNDSLSGANTVKTPDDWDLT